MTKERPDNLLDFIQLYDEILTDLRLFFEEWAGLVLPVIERFIQDVEQMTVALAARILPALYAFFLEVQRFQFRIWLCQKGCPQWLASWIASHTPAVILAQLGSLIDDWSDLQAWEEAHPDQVTIPD